MAPRLASPRRGARSLSLFALSGLAVGGLALTGVPPSGAASSADVPAPVRTIDGFSPAPVRTIDGFSPALVRTIDGFYPSWQVVDPGAAAPEGRDAVSPDGRPQVRSDVAHVTEALAGIDLTIAVAYEGADGEPIDATRIRAWLEDRGSPMAPYAEELVTAGIAHDVDPRLVVGIAAIESSAGEALPPGSHNAWGWGGGGAYGLAAWPSWPAAIDDYTEGLARVYDTDHVDETMARKYVPPNWQKWLRTVRWVIDDI